MIHLVILSLIATFYAPGDCDVASMTSECVRQMPRKFSALKSFPLAKKRDQSYAECSYVFTKGTRYNIGACFNFKDNWKIEVYNSRRSLVASVEGKKKYSKLAYKCVSSGIYYMRFSIESPSDICGASLISFSKK